MRTNRVSAMLRLVEIEEPSVNEIQSHLERAKVHSFVHLSPAKELGQLTAAVLLAFWLSLESVPTRTILWWYLGIAVAIAIRRIVRGVVARSYLRRDVPKFLVPGAISLAAVAWGAAPLLIVPHVTSNTMTLMALVFAALISAASLTLVTDVVSYVVFTLCLLGSVITGVLLLGSSPSAWIEVVLIVLFGVVAVASHMRNVSERKAHLAATLQLRAREALAARERAYLDALIASAPLGIATSDQHGALVVTNPAFERMFGFSADEFAGRHLGELVVPHDREDNAPELNPQLARERAFIEQTVRLCRDGSRIPVRVSAAMGEGMAEGTLFLLYDDQTEAQQAQDKWLASEDRYRDIIQSSSDLVWEMDPAGCWTFLNPTCETVFGAAPAAMMGVSYRRGLVEDSAEQVAAFDLLFAGHTVHHVDLAYGDPGGAVRHLSFSGRPVFGPDGAIVGARGAAHDVTDRVAARTAVERARSEAVRIAELRSAFLANMSHELRTPMNGILGMTEIVLDSSLTGDQRHSLELVRGSAEALLHIVDDMLDFARLEEGRLTVRESIFDLHGLVDTLVRMLSVNASERGLELRADIAETTPRFVRGDPGRIRRVLTHLLGNALKFTLRGKVTIVVSPRVADIEFAVHDTGVGIAPSQLAEIFEGFSQADMTLTRQFGGMGLGLAIAHQVVGLMGGKLGVESTVGQGSVFTVHLSLPPATPPQRPSAPTTQPWVGAPALVISHDDKERVTVSGMLEKIGMTVDHLADAQAAIQEMSRAAARGKGYRLVIVDAQFPGGDGFALCEAIRDRQLEVEPVLLLLASLGRPGDGARCEDIGIDAYLPKPITQVALLDLVTTAFEHPDDPAERAFVTQHLVEEQRQPMRVLLAEDNVVNQKVAATMLRRRGHHVLVVENGQSALEALDHSDFDVVLMDVQMPVMDGLSASRAIRAKYAESDLPIVAVTAHALASERQQCIDAGMNAFLRKPFNAKDLFDAVERVGGSPDNEALAVGQGNSIARRPVATVPVLDILAFRSAMREAGVEGAVESMLLLFRQDAPSRYDAIRDALGSHQNAAIAATAHALKSAAGTIYALRLADVLTQIEQAAKSEGLEREHNWVRQLEHAFVLTMSALDDELGLQESETP